MFGLVVPGLEACWAASSSTETATPSRCEQPRLVPPTGPNYVRAYDFVFDTCATGQQIKCLTAVDEWKREAL